MCIIQGDVQNVSETNILISTVKYQSNLQLVAYSNQVKIKDSPVAMILPFPNFRKSNSVKVIPTTEKDNTIFTYLDYIFTYARYYSDESVSISIPVHRAGSYQYSIVNHIDDLKNIDNDVFQLYDKNIESIFRKYYSEFGFIVCIIDKSAKYSPFVYITEKLPNNRYFIPTRHYHGHISEKDNWDHKIYVLGTDHKYKIKSTKNVELSYPVINIDMEEITCGKYLPAFEKNECLLISLNGNLINDDIIIKAVKTTYLLIKN